MKQMKRFSSWYPLTEEGIAGHAPGGAAALQVKRARGLVEYPAGKSAMLWYAYASQDAARTLRECFGDELDTRECRGHGPLLFRYAAGGEEARETVDYVFRRFLTNFGAPPVFNDSDSA